MVARFIRQDGGLARQPPLLYLAWHTCHKWLVHLVFFPRIRTSGRHFTMKMHTLSPSASIPHVVVVGAGYSGLMAALHLAGRTRRQRVSITLFNASDQFIERIRLHQLA